MVESTHGPNAPVFSCEMTGTDIRRCTDQQGEAERPAFRGRAEKQGIAGLLGVFSMNDLKRSQFATVLRPVPGLVRRGQVCSGLWLRDGLLPQAAP